MLLLENVTKSFVDTFEPVLKGISLTIQKTDFCMVIGSNGSGKSTLMKTISGEYTIDSGRIIIDGKEQVDRSHLVATVVQDTSKGTIPEMTLLENMMLSHLRGKKAELALYSHYKEEAVRQIKELGIGLESYIDRPLSSLSGGQRQMIATLMMVNSKPEILLLDEHTSALDPKMQHRLMEYTAKSIQSHQITSLMITHKLDDAIKYGNRLIMLHQGRVVLDANEEQKAAFTVDKLLSLFHKYEDLTLTSEEGEIHVN